MAILKSSIRRMLLIASALAISSATATELRHAGDSRVQVGWTDPADFSEARQNYGGGLGRPSPEEWLGDLARHLGHRAERVLPQGERLQVTFTNVQRAGTYEPWRGPMWDDVRIVKNIYPPRIDLTFTLTDASGAVIKEGRRELRDPAFLQRGTLNETDPLRYEKRMLDDWLRSEFADARDTRS
jgi:hypothetical protein